MCVCALLYARKCIYICVRAVFLEGIDLSVIHRKGFRGSKLTLALALCSPQRRDIDVLLSNELFRNEGEKRKKVEVCLKGMLPIRMPIHW